MTLLPHPPRQAPAETGAGELVLRPATAADLDSLAALEKTAFEGDRLTRRRLRALTAGPSARLVVAERGGRVVGYALLLLRRGSMVARLYSIAVAAAEAGRGTGRRLMAFAEAAARSAGAETLRLEVRADNDRAIPLYTSMGYAAIGERPHYYEDGMTALRYQKSLLETGA
ncbi:MAG TPA: GNAT family N-acetyltransferase [Afifellaceae bacterium]|nr:GNAT family N-acetyltransferase [Afifellaceae bacterium]